MHFPIFPQNKFNVFTTKYLNVTQCRLKSLPCIENFSRIQINYSSSFFPPLCYYLMDREEVLIRVYYGSSAPQQLLFFGDAECRLPEQLNGSYCQDKTYYLHSLAHVATPTFRMNFGRSLGAHEQILGNVMYRPLLEFWNPLVGYLMAAFTGLKALLKHCNHLKPFILILTGLKHYWRITDIELIDQKIKTYQSMRKSDSSQKRHNRIYRANDCWGENMSYCFLYFPPSIIYNCLAGFRVENAFNSEILMTIQVRWRSSCTSTLRMFWLYIISLSALISCNWIRVN